MLGVDLLGMKPMRWSLLLGSFEVRTLFLFSLDMRCIVYYVVKKIIKQLNPYFPSCLIVKELSYSQHEFLFFMFAFAICTCITLMFHVYNRGVHGLFRTQDQTEYRKIRYGLNRKFSIWVDIWSKTFSEIWSCTVPIFYNVLKDRFMYWVNKVEIITCKEFG